mmetsp:Transcript_22696/g.42753  ORF Transcript_22696/g.42753 Transcript_22696/m.42753 type:complete len:98 (+) Transcript_22696:102-395(+)
MLLHCSGLLSPLSYVLVKLCKNLYYQNGVSKIQYLQNSYFEQVYAGCKEQIIMTRRVASEIFQILFPAILLPPMDGRRQTDRDSPIDTAKAKAKEDV